MPTVRALLGKCQGTVITRPLQSGAAMAGEEEQEEEKGSSGSFSCVDVTGPGSPAQLLLPWEV